MKYLSGYTDAKSPFSCKSLGKERLMTDTTELPETVTEFLEDGSVAVTSSAT